MGVKINNKSIIIPKVYSVPVYLRLGKFYLLFIKKFENQWFFYPINVITSEPIVGQIGGN